MTKETLVLQRKAACRKEEREVMNQGGVEAVRNEEASSFLTTSEDGNTAQIWHFQITFPVSSSTLRSCRSV